MEYYHHRHHLRNRQDHRNPSFSSTLLDQIYNSIDDSSTKKQNQNRTDVDPRKTFDAYVRSTNRKITEPTFFKHSSSSSSDSSGFSSSESDSFYKRSKSVPHPKPIRTTTVNKTPKPEQQPPPKSKASKFYSEVKQPISPGGRLHSFLNSIFTGKPNKINTKRASTVDASSTTTCSSASSFSRSCLSKTPSSSEKSKRSVRFVDDEFKKERQSLENRRVIEAAKELLRTYQKKKDVVAFKISDDDEEEEDEDDLFELDNLSVIGSERFREELPVYETTRLNTNRIIF